MKTKLLIALFCSFSLLATAQSNFTAYGKRVVVGITVGPSVDWLSAKNEDIQKGGAIMGVRAGIPLDINLTADENYYVSTGIMFNYTGGKHIIPANILPENSIDAMHTITRKYRASYVTLISGIKLKTPSFSNCVIVGNAGLYHSFFLGGNMMDSYIVNKVEMTAKAKNKNVAFLKESVYVGLGFEYIIKDNLKVNMMVNYTYTFNNFFNKNAIIHTNERMKGNLNGVEILFGFFF